MKREKNTVYFITKTSPSQKIPLPVKKIEAIHAFGSVDLNKKLLTFFAQERIPIHFYNYYGYYSGTYYPRKYLQSGFLLVNQVKHYLKDERRLFLAREFVRGSTHNIRKNLLYYDRKGNDLGGPIRDIERLQQQVEETTDIPDLMGMEGNVRERYYQSFGTFLREPFSLSKRVYRPPNNMMNCLISFGNSLLYNAVLTQIYRTQLDPTISYLHEPSERRFSLSLDISELFKPVIVDKVIFKLVNKHEIQQKHFKEKMNYCHLNDKGKKRFVQAWDDKLKDTIKHQRLNRHVSYKRLLRIECYKLVRHLSDDQTYEGFRQWW